MPLLDWQDRYRTGIDAVDYEHRELIGLLNSLHDRLGEKAGKDEIADFLGEVHAGIAAHFALEEEIMRRFGYDRYDQHKADHEKLLEEIRDIMDEHEEGAFHELEGALAERLHDWFSVHFRTMDVSLHRMLATSHPAGD